MAIGELYKLNVRATQFSVNIENRYWYLQVSVSGDADLLIDAWVEDVLPSCLPVQNDLVLYVEAESVNQENPADFITKPVVATGAIAGESLPPFCQWSFKMATTDSRIRSGGKRFAGVPELQQIDGTATGAALVALNTLATALGALVVDSVSGATFVPILHTDGNVATGGAPLNVTMGPVTYVQLSSQLSRKLF